MDASLRALKVADLRHVLATAAVAAPARATKADLVARILASQQAVDAFHSLYPPTPAQPPSAPASVKQPTPPPASPDPSLKSASPPPSKPSEPANPELEKRKQRAERFGTTAAPDNDDAPSDPELEKRKKRAERFGIPLVDPATKNAATKRRPANDAEKLEARAERFGAANHGTAGKKRAAPAETVDAAERERRRKRAERFGL